MFREGKVCGGLSAEEIYIRKGGSGYIRAVLYAYIV